MMSFGFDRPKPPEAYYEMLDVGLERANVAVCVIELTSPEGPLLYANSVWRELFPQPEGGLPVGAPLTRWFPNPAWIAPMMETLRAGKLWQAPKPAEITQPKVTLEVNATPKEMGAQGQPPRWAVIVLRDAAAMWQDVRLERERERQRVMMESFGTICHAIGQPMTVLMSSVEMMRLNLVDEAGRKEMTEMCYEAAIEIRDLLQKLNEKRHYATEQYRKTANHADEIVSLFEQDSPIAPIDGLSEAVAHALEPTADPPATPSDDGGFEDSLFNL